ncbi:peptidylprolyl isomerase, partial [Peptoniphilus asaccharolyticus]
MEKQVIAKIDGVEITTAHYENFLRQLNPQLREYYNKKGFSKEILDELISQQLLVIDAREKGYDKNEDFLEVLKSTEDSLLMTYALGKTLENIEISEEEIKKYYEENKDHFKQGPTVSASHILVETEEEANEIAKEINAENFAEIAKEKSSCPSSANGGSLGEFSQGQMVPEFDQKVFSMEVGEISEPVKTQFGYHIIKLDG